MREQVYMTSMKYLVVERPEDRRTFKHFNQHNIINNIINK